MTSSPITVKHHKNPSRVLLEIGSQLLRLIPPELAHDVSMWLLEKGFLNYFDLFAARPSLSGLSANIPGIGYLHHPIGLAAGFDKNARCPGAFARMGFAFIELGTVTPRSQAGNPKPRLFRLPTSHGLINRMGFNNDGLATIKQRIDTLHWQRDLVPLGVNVGKNRSTLPEDTIEDYVVGIDAFREVSSYLVVNISSPNTPGLRGLAHSDFLGRLAKEVTQQLPQIFVKLDPDMNRRDFQKTVELIAKEGYQGVILCNTHSVNWPETGGQSGAMLAGLSQSYLEWAYEVHQGSLIMIASGGIFTGLDVFQRMIRGASAVQIYSALIYRGPWAVTEILNELCAEMKLRGITNLSDVVGSYYHGHDTTSRP